MNSTKKAARIGGKDLAAGIASASASAKARIAKLDSQDIDGVAGGIDLGGDTGGLGGGDGSTAGMIDPDPIGGSFKTIGS
jgi:hypothetical protein